MSACMYVYIYIYIGYSRCAVVRYETVLRRTRQCSNRSRLLKFRASKVIPHLAITGELWGVFVRYMYKNDCDTSRVHYISLSKSTGMKLSYKRIWYIYMCVLMCMYVYIYIYVYICVYMYVYVYIFLMCNQCYVPVFYCTCTFWCEIYEHKKLPFKRHLF